MKLNKLQIGVLLGIVLLTVLLFMLPKKALNNDNKDGATRDKPQTQDAGTKESLKTLETILTESIASLTEAEKEGLKLGDTSAVSTLKNVMAAYKKLDNKLGIAICMERLTESGSEMTLGLAYYEAFKQSTIIENKKAIAAKVIELLKPVFEKNPEDISIKCALADCYVNTSENPMSGIMLLREIIAKDSTNENALFLLGEFAIRSEQMDKALVRFESLVRHYPKNVKYSLYLAQLFSNQGDQVKALETLNNVKKYAKRESAIDSINSSINHLK